MEGQRKRERTKVGMARARAQGEVLGSLVPLSLSPKSNIKTGLLLGKQVSLIMTLRDVGVNDSMINEWMGWRSGNPAAPMVSTYSYGDKEIDAKGQKKHSFIKLWK